MFLIDKAIKQYNFHKFVVGNKLHTTTEGQVGVQGKNLTHFMYPIANFVENIYI